MSAEEGQRLASPMDHMIGQEGYESQEGFQHVHLQFKIGPAKHIGTKRTQIKMGCIQTIMLMYLGTLVKFDRKCRWRCPTLNLQKHSTHCVISFFQNDNPSMNQVIF